MNVWKVFGDETLEGTYWVAGVSPDNKKFVKLVYISYNASDGKIIVLPSDIFVSPSWYHNNKITHYMEVEPPDYPK